jgi:hypothetical protein
MRAKHADILYDFNKLEGTVDNLRKRVTDIMGEKQSMSDYEPRIVRRPQTTPLRQDSPNEGVKGDSGKPDLSLLSPTWIFGVGEVLTYGAEKRGAHNWRKGLKITRLCAGALRHIFQFLAGEDLDRDPSCEGCKANDCLKHSGLHHLDCASCNLMFARELLVTRPELDDRYKANATP